MKKIIPFTLLLSASLPAIGALPDATVTNAIAQAVEGTPIVDGQIDSIWDSATAYPIEVFVQSGRNDLVPPSSTDDLSGTFKALWDSTNLYILVEAKDSELPFGAASAIEVYTSTAYTRQFGEWQNPGYDSVSDTQIKYNISSNPPTILHGLYSYGGDLSPFVGSTAALTEVAGGYILEIVLSWNSLIDVESGVTWDPEVGMFFGGLSEYQERDFIGFEIMLQDNDNEDTIRDTKLAWCGGYENEFERRIGDFAWADTSVWGTLQLVKADVPLCTVLDTVLVGDYFPSVGNDYVYAVGYDAFLYTGFCPFVYDFKGGNFWYVFEGSTDPNGFFVYNFGDSTWYYMYFSYLLPLAAE